MSIAVWYWSKCLITLVRPLPSELTILQPLTLHVKRRLLSDWSDFSIGAPGVLLLSWTLRICLEDHFFTFRTDVAFVLVCFLELCWERGSVSLSSPDIILTSTSFWKNEKSFSMSESNSFHRSICLKKRSPNLKLNKDVFFSFPLFVCLWQIEIFKFLYFENF